MPLVLALAAKEAWSGMAAHCASAVGAWDSAKHRQGSCGPVRMQTAKAQLWMSTSQRVLHDISCPRQYQSQHRVPVRQNDKDTCRQLVRTMITVNMHRLSGSNEEPAQRELGSERIAA
jgi:hypothetical protein